jgi:hypothetical protein
MMTDAAYFHAMAATMKRTPRMAAQTPLGRKVIPATSRSTGPIQQMPGNIRRPATANRTGITPTTTRIKRFMAIIPEIHRPFTRYSTPLAKHPSI